jgi:hypothetical protein
MSILGFRTKLALAAAVGLMSACGSSPSSPTPVSTPQASQARIAVTAGAPVITRSPLANFTFRLTIPVTIAESGGVGANINFIRLSLIRAGVEIERQEVSSTGLITQTGSNRLAASSNRTLQLIYDVNAGSATSGVLECNFTDDRGNALRSTFTITF